MVVGDGWFEVYFSVLLWSKAKLLFLDLDFDQAEKLFGFEERKREKEKKKTPLRVGSSRTSIVGEAVLPPPRTLV